MTNWTRRMRLEHRCPLCGELNDRHPKWKCARCFGRHARANRRAAKARRVRLVLAGLCIKCGRNRAGKFARCVECRLDLTDAA
jgi:hypothetical protein